jgi:ABC-type branched-subunit amino acid transport system ATPase component
VFALFGSIASLGMLLVAFTPPLWLAVFGITFFFFGVSLTGPAQAAILSQVVPPNVRGVGVQVLALSALPAFGFGVPIFGQLVVNQGWGAAIGVSVPLMILGSIVFGSAGGTFDLDRRSAFAASLAAESWREAKESGAAKLLVCRDLTVHYDNVQVLFGVDLDITDGEIIALLGTNGAGKSTLLRAISGTHEASGGAVVFDGRDVTHMPPHEIAHRGVVMMPGGRGVFPALTVRENLLLAKGLMADDADVDERLADVFEIFPILRERAGAAAGALSGGEQQQLSLAQAFLANPRLLLIDELSLGLSPVVTGELIEKVREIHARGTTVVVVEQSVNVALELASRAVFMEKGAVRFSGPTAELLARPDILRAVYVKGTGGNAAAATDVRRIERLQAAPVALEVEGIEKRYGGVTALDGVSFSVPTGMVLGIIGPNGSGKTSLFDVISGFQTPDAGAVRMEGVDITGLRASERAEAGLIRRFQDARLFPSLTVYETLLLALDQQLATKSTLANAVALPSTRRAERRLAKRADELIELLGLGAYRDKFVKELSTGLRRITDLACTLARQPRVLLLDEPSSGIAQAEAEGLAPLLRRIQHETGTTMLVIEHDVPLLTRVADELLVLATGSVLARGAANVVLEDERVVEAYLGTSDAAVNRSGARS